MNSYYYLIYEIYAKIVMNVMNLKTIKNYFLHYIVL